MSDTPQGPGWWQASDGKWYAPQPAAGAAPAAGQQTPTEAIISLVAGIVSILLCGCWGIGIIVGGVGVYFGMQSKKKIAESNGTMGGAGLAQAGYICGIVGIALGVISLIFFIISIATGNGSFSYSVN